MSDGRLYIPNSKGCFVCGEENAAGLKTRFYIEDGKVKMPFRAEAMHCGFPRVAHGGVVAAALDECMGWTATREYGRFVVTAELQIRYLRPIPIETDLLVQAALDKSHRRMARATGELVSYEGEVYARATGAFVPISEEETREVNDWLLYRGGEVRLFPALENPEAAP